MNAFLSTIDAKLADLIANFDTVTFIGSSKAVLTNRNLIGDCWNLRELHGYKNRFNNARIYKKGKLVRTTDKYNLADEINFDTVVIEDEPLEYEQLDAFIQTNLSCGCEVTILDNGEKYVCRCNTEECICKDHFYGYHI